MAANRNNFWDLWGVRLAVMALALAFAGYTWAARQQHFAAIAAGRELNARQDRRLMEIERRITERGQQLDRIESGVKRLEARK